MQTVKSNVKQRILVIGAGELGLAVLRGLAARSTESSTIAVLLRESTVNSQAPEKRREIEAIKQLGIVIELADVVDATVDELATVLSRYDTVISCMGFAAGRGTRSRAQIAGEALHPVAIRGRLRPYRARQPTRLIR